MDYFISGVLQKNTIVFSRLKETTKGGVSITFSIGKKKTIVFLTIKEAAVFLKSPYKKAIVCLSNEIDDEMWSIFSMG
jgi:hypothetical protein